MSKSFVANWFYSGIPGVAHPFSALSIFITNMESGSHFDVAFFLSSSLFLPIDLPVLPP